VAALEGNYGMLTQLDDNTPLAVGDNRLQAEKRYRARFHFDPNSIAMSHGNAHELLRGFAGTWPPALGIELRFWNGTYQVRAGLLNDGTTWRYGLWFPIADEPHSLEIDWQAASAPNANNGSLSFWIDGVERSQLTGVDNDTRHVDLVRLGALSSIDTGTRGSYYFDAFESRRLTYIGPATGATVVPAGSNPAELTAWTEEEMQEDTLPQEEIPQLFLPWTRR
jgi:hypothetical protein